VQLLGQTVQFDADSSTRKMRFSGVAVRRVAEVPGIAGGCDSRHRSTDSARTSWQQSNPNPQLCNHVHPPVQSDQAGAAGDAADFIRASNMEKITMIRNAKRPISITTDIIVGFPGETEADFQETLTLLDAVKYEGIFSFKYSPRPNTPGTEDGPIRFRRKRRPPIGGAAGTAAADSE